MSDQPDHGLGTSIADVLRRTPRAKESPRGFLEVDINAIVPPADNPRQIFEPEALQELADSIRLHGILQPLVVLKRPAGYEVLSGERRYRAAKMAGLERVPVVVRDDENDQEIAELRLIENIQRADLNPIELAQAYQTLIGQFGLTQDALADRLGKKRSSITNSVRLLTLDREVLALVASGELSMGHAKVLLGVEDREQQKTLAQRCVQAAWSVRTLEATLRLAGLEGRPAAKAERPSHLRELESNLQQLLGAKVRVEEKGGKGSLTIYFASPAEFQELIGRVDHLLRRETPPA